MKTRICLILAISFVHISIVNADEQVGLERAKGPALSAAVGHYSRARSLLLAALREFDQGRTIANPDVMLDAKVWREDIEARAIDLERILDPQPRASKTAVKYSADPRLLNGSGGTN